MLCFVEMLFESLTLTIKKLNRSSQFEIQESIGKETCFARIEGNKQIHLLKLFM